MSPRGGLPKLRVTRGPRGPLVVERLDPGGHVQLEVALRQEQLDVVHALVGGLGQQLVRVPGFQVGREQHEPAQVYWPSARAVNTSGQERPMRATRIRFLASFSESLSSPMQ